MRIGVSLPDREFRSDFGKLQEFVEAAESLGYCHIRMAEHVLGADPRFHPQVTFPYTFEQYWNEPFTLLAYLASITRSVELSSALILPLRQTALVAKQAAQVDLLSGGRLRLVAVLSWNPVEYEAMGVDFRTRGDLCEEQVDVLRELWTNETIEFHGRWHTIRHAGINPLPVQRPIHIWMGAGTVDNPIPRDTPLRRVARIADGWVAMAWLRPGEGGQASAFRLREYAREAGRDPGNIGIEAGIRLEGGTTEDWAREVAQWREAGATHLTVITAGDGTGSPQPHIQALRQFKEITPLE